MTERRAMEEDVNETIRDLARTTPHGIHELSAIAAAYPDAAFLRFAVASWGSGVRLTLWQLAEFFYGPPQNTSVRWGST